VRKVYLDCGAWRGVTVKKFIEKRSNQFDIYAFECHPQFTHRLARIPSINTIMRAVWVKDEELTFYPGKTTKNPRVCKKWSHSGTLLKEKTRGIDQHKSFKVQAIDFSKWITTNLSKDDYIICKLNIEGAEYEVLNHLLNTKVISYINKLYVDWHYDKIKMNKKDHNKLLAKVTAKIKVGIWSDLF